ncbi:hypothetical protein BsWGS_26683 [Bradybaena similaris]
MQQNGTKQILMMSYAIILYFSATQAGQVWTEEASEKNQIAQKTSEWTPMSTSRSQMLQYISSLLLLKQPSTDIKDSDILQPWLEDSPSDTSPIRFPANRNQRMRVAKRQRPCFWSVVTCY